MKASEFLILLFVVVIACAGSYVIGLNQQTIFSPTDPQSTNRFIEVTFTPQGHSFKTPLDLTLEWINRANTSIHCLIYSFTLEEIADALIDVSYRGVEVQILFDDSQVSQYSQYHRLVDAPTIDVRQYSGSGLMHHKVMILDNSTVLLGSFNWSNNAITRNQENWNRIPDHRVNRLYEAEFQDLWARGAL